MSELEVQRLGLIPYDECWELQKKLQADLVAGNGKETLLVCKHQPVFTLGRSTKNEHVFTSKEDLQALGYSVFEVERGGSITYHGPEQLIIYPIIDLTKKKKDVHWYMRTLEDVAIKTLAEFDILSERIEGKTGVWVSIDETPAKIAFIGVRISRWKTMHGLSINLEDCSQHFNLIDPCGLGAVRITSLSEIKKQIPDYTKIEASLIQNFVKTFEFKSTVC